MSPALRPVKCVVTPDGTTLDVSAARALVRAVLDGGRPAACIVDLAHVRDLHDASLALLAELACAGVEFLGLGEHHRRVLRYLLADGPRASAAGT
jgi:hypothetical protein